MTTENFNKVVKDILTNSENTLIKKSNEYSNDKDRLCAFKSAAILQNISPIKALAGMMSKHTTSIYEMIYSDKKYTEDKWNEKIIDHINYLILLKGLLIEEGFLKED